MVTATTPDTELLKRAYVAFNARDLDGALSTMKPDVTWPNGMEGGTVHGHDGVRAYWTRQWGMIDPMSSPGLSPSILLAESSSEFTRWCMTEPASFCWIGWSEHIYTIKDGLIRSMDIRE